MEKFRLGSLMMEKLKVDRDQIRICQESACGRDSLLEDDDRRNDRRKTTSWWHRSGDTGEELGGEFYLVIRDEEWVLLYRYMNFMKRARGRYSSLLRGSFSLLVYQWKACMLRVLKWKQPSKSRGIFVSICINLVRCLYGRRSTSDRLPDARFK